MSLDLIRERAQKRNIPDVVQITSGDGLDGLYPAHRVARSAETARVAAIVVQRGAGRGM